MSLLLAIEISSNDYHVVIGKDNKPVFNSLDNYPLPPSPDLKELISFGLKSINSTINDISAVALNVGPGALSYVRTGVAFVNALAFSLNIPIYPFNYFEIIAHEVRTQTKTPIVCTIPAPDDYVYAALIRENCKNVLKFDLFDPTVQAMTVGLSEVAIAGKMRQRLLDTITWTKVIDTNITKPSAFSLLELGHQAMSNNGGIGQVTPLNDQSEIFYE